MRAKKTDDKHLLEQARDVLVKFGLAGDVAAKVQLPNLSGGQKARVNFAFLSLRPCHLLFLDEPTNHLDASACEDLAEAIINFKGGVVLVSHDEWLIQRFLDSGNADLLICEAGLGKFLVVQHLD